MQLAPSSRKSAAVDRRPWDYGGRLRRHDPQFVLQAEDHTKDIGVESGGIGLRSLIDERAGLSFRAGVIHCDINTAKSFDGLIDQLPDIILMADIRLNELSLSSQGAEFLSEFKTFLLAPAGNDDLCAVVGESQRGSAADTGESASDKNDERRFSGFHNGISGFVIVW
jgi:hypothetical protein